MQWICNMKFSEISAIVNPHGKFNRKLTFHNFHLAQQLAFLTHGIFSSLALLLLFALLSQLPRNARREGWREGRRDR